MSLSHFVGPQLNQAENQDQKGASREVEEKKAETEKADTEQKDDVPKDAAAMPGRPPTGYLYGVQQFPHAILVSFTLDGLGLRRQILAKLGDNPIM